MLRDSGVTAHLRQVQFSAASLTYKKPGSQRTGLLCVWAKGYCSIADTMNRVFSLEYSSKWILAMQDKRVFLPTVLLSMLLMGFCTYMAVKPAEVRARSEAPKPTSGVAYVSFAEGNVTVNAMNRGVGNLKKGQTVFPGDVIDTGTDGRVVL